MINSTKHTQCRCGYRKKENILFPFILKAVTVMRCETYTQAHNTITEKKARWQNKQERRKKREEKEEKEQLLLFLDFFIAHENTVLLNKNEKLFRKIARGGKIKINLLKLFFFHSRGCNLRFFYQHLTCNFYQNI